MLHAHRVYQPYPWADITDAVLRARMQEGSRAQIGRYVVSSPLTFEEAEFLGGPVAVLAVVDDFGNLRRVSS